MNTNEKYREVNNIGFILRKKRVQKDLSQDELSRQANITRTFLSLIENGHRKPSLNTLEILASRLDSKASDLICEAKNGDGDPKIRLAYLLEKLARSKDNEKVIKLLEFAHSLNLE